MIFEVEASVPLGERARRRSLPGIQLGYELWTLGHRRIPLGTLSPKAPSSQERRARSEGKARTRQLGHSDGDEGNGRPTQVPQKKPGLKMALQDGLNLTNNTCQAFTSSSAMLGSPTPKSAS